MSALSSIKPNTCLPRAVIFGAGKAGESALANLRSSYNIIAFVDNDIKKQGLTLNGLPICSVKDIEHDDAMIFIASEFFEQIKSQLMDSSSIAESQVKAVPARYLKAMSFGDGNNVKELEILKAICNCLELSGVNYHVDAGSLLGLYRDGRLISWDDDLDIAINASDLEITVRILPNIIQRLAIVTDTKWHATEHFTTVAFGNIQEGEVRSFKLNAVNAGGMPSTDLFIKYVDQNYSDYCLASRGVRMPARFMNDTKLFQAAGHNWRVPTETEAYLACHYGKNWRTPNPNWSLQDLDNTKIFDV
jgi:hypothetical protein